MEARRQAIQSKADRAGGCEKRMAPSHDDAGDSVVERPDWLLGSSKLRRHAHLVCSAGGYLFTGTKVNGTYESTMPSQADANAFARTLVSRASYTGAAKICSPHTN